MQEQETFHSFRIPEEPLLVSSEKKSQLKSCLAKLVEVQSALTEILEEPLNGINNNNHTLINESLGIELGTSDDLSCEKDDSNVVNISSSSSSSSPELSHGDKENVHPAAKNSNLASNTNSVKSH